MTPRIQFIYTIAMLIVNCVASIYAGFSEEPAVRPGLDVLIERHLDVIQNARVGIIANHTSVNASDEHIVDILSRHCKVTALFAPEHGFLGDRSAGASVSDHAYNKIPIFSLYGSFRAPTPSMMQQVDVLVFDLQDVGARFYTYTSVLYLALYAAKREQIPILVLDRPNPIGADRVDGPIVLPAYTSYVGVLPIPIRYGMTIGELSQLMNREPLAGFKLDADLTVIPMRNYRRSMWYNQTGLRWIPPSPNMTTLDTAAVYPGMCLFEGTNLSEGRGTGDPFLTVGAPFIDAKRWRESIPTELLSGLTIEETSFTPVSIPGKAEKPKFQNRRCFGLKLIPNEYERIRSIELAVALLCSAKKLFPDDFQVTRTMDRLWGGEDLRAMIDENNSFSDIVDLYRNDLDSFESVRTRYLMYTDENE